MYYLFSLRGAEMAPPPYLKALSYEAKDEFLISNKICFTVDHFKVMIRFEISFLEKFKSYLQGAGGAGGGQISPSRKILPN